MKKMIIVLTVMLMLLLSSTVFASAASDPAVTIVNPANQSAVASDSLLVSVKMTQPKTIKVYVYEIKQVVNGVESSIDVNALVKMSEKSTAAGGKTTETAGTAGGKAADTGSAVAGGGSGTTAAGISEKEKKYVAVGDGEKFTCSNELSFATKQVNDLTPGLYAVRVDTIDSAGKKLYSSEAQVAVLGKQTAEEQGKIFETPQNGALQFFQNLLKNLFKQAGN